MHCCLRLLTGVTMAMLIFVLARTRLQHALLLPGLILGAIVLAHLMLWLSGTTLQAASAAGWFLQPFSGSHLQDALLHIRLDRVEWGALFVHGGSAVTIAVLIPIVVLLNATGLEISLERDADLDRELRVNGVGNLLVGLCGGTVGNLAPGNTRLNVAAGADRRLAGLVAASVCAALLVAGGDALGYVPTFLVGGLILAVGIAFLYEWVYRSWFQLERFDYVLVRRLRTFSGGTLFGEMGVYAGERRSATVRTDQASVLYFLSMPRFEEMERSAPQLAERFGKFIVCLLAERLRHTNLSFGMKG